MWPALLVCLVALVGSVCAAVCYRTGRVGVGRAATAVVLVSGLTGLGSALLALVALLLRPISAGEGATGSSRVGDATV